VCNGDGDVDEMGRFLGDCKDSDLAVARKSSASKTEVQSPLAPGNAVPAC
jgi:hypothetical protein